MHVVSIRLLAVVAMLIALLSVGCAGTQTVDTPGTPSSIGTPNDTGGPRELVRRLNHIGIPDSLNGRGWGPSRSEDGRWIAILVRDFPIDELLENEVSCWFESTDQSRIHHLELSAELYRARYFKADVMDLFKQAAHEVCPNPPSSLLRSIDRRSSWSGDGWTLEIIDYGNRTNGYEVMLRWKE